MRKLYFVVVCVSALLSVPIMGECQLTRTQAKVAMQAYNNVFYNQYGTYGSSYKAMYYDNTYRNSRASFWREVEQIETLIDAYYINNDADFKNKIQYLYNGIRDGYGLTWSNNPFNDDVIWGALMCIRAFAIHNDGGMKDMAINNFNIVWNRAWDNSLGGGLWWKTDKKSKNACVNAPAALCAMYLYYATGDVSYRNKAKQIMDWMKSHLYDAGSGEVKGAMNTAGVITEGSRTYTQGVFIGAAGEMQKYYAGENWKAVGQKAMDFAKNVMSNNGGLLPDEYCGVDDCPGFKSIFARWACKFAKDQNLVSSYSAWLNYNANQAWNNRNSSGLIWAQFGRRTSDAYLNSWETSSGVSMVTNVFLYAGSSVRESSEEELTIPVEITNAVSVYPNPAEKRIRIDYSDDSSEGHMQILNSTGSVVQEAKLTTGEYDIAALPAGVYIMVIRKNGTQTNKRFVKK